MTQVKVNFNGNMLSYGYLWSDGVLQIKCCSGMYTVPCEEEPASISELHSLVREVIAAGAVPPCSGAGH